MFSFVLGFLGFVFALGYSCWIAYQWILVETKETLRLLGKRSVLLVIAHPDDECMFFSPIITSLISAGVSLHVLCLSTGNNDGLGEIRKKELTKSCAVLGVKSTIIDDELLKDGWREWEAENVSDVLEVVLETHKGINTLMTFDRNGISGHPNHCSVWNGVRYFASIAEKDYSLLELETVPVVCKYIGILSSIYDYVNEGIQRTLPKESSQSKRVFVGVSSIRQFVKGFSAMRQHKSQLAWFRFLYLIFSRYMTINSLILRVPKFE